MGILLKMVVNGVFAILSGGFVHYLYFQSGEIIDSTSFFAWCLESLIQIWVHFHVKKKLCFFGWHLLFLWGINLSTPCHHPAPQSAAQQASSRVVGNFHLLTKKTAGFWCIFSSVKKKGGHKKASPHSTLEKPLEEWIQKKMRLIDIIESIVFFCILLRFSSKCPLHLKTRHRTSTARFLWKGGYPNKPWRIPDVPFHG